MSLDSQLQQRKVQADLEREQGLIQPESAEPVQKETGMLARSRDIALGFQTPDYADKPFLRKVGEDAALLSYAIPAGLAQMITHPIEFVKQAPGALLQSAKDLFDPSYYKAHPLLGVVNAFGFVAPVAGAAKSAALKTSMQTALQTGVKQAVDLGVTEAVVRTALTTGMKESGGLLVKRGAVGTAVWEAAKTGKMEIVTETVKNLLVKNGVADDVALRVGTAMADTLYSSFSRQTTKMKVLETVSHPFGASAKFIASKADPLKKAIFGTPEKTAVARMYGVDEVKKDPEGFLAIERWAEAQLREQGFDNTPDNRQLVMQKWAEDNSEWAALDPKGRIDYHKNYVKGDETRRLLHKATGIDIVTTKRLPENYVESMIETLEATPEKNVTKLTELLDQEFGRDYSIHANELNQATTKAALIARIRRLSKGGSTISFAKHPPEVQALAAALEKSGYRIGYAPTNKELSFATDVFAGVKRNSEKVFRTGSEPFDPNKVGRDGIFVSPSEFVAGTFGGKVKEKLYISSDAKVLKYSDIPEKFKDFTGKDVQKVQTELADYAREKGFDVIELSEIERQVINPKVLETVNKVKGSAVTDAALNTQRTAVGEWVKYLGLSPEGTPIGSAEYLFREGFTQRAIAAFPNKVKAGKVSIPVEKLYEWLDKKRIPIAESDRFSRLPFRTVFDMKAADFERAGFSPADALKIRQIAKESLRSVPASVTGAGDAIVNYVRTLDKGFNRWMSTSFNWYLNAANKMRYDWSPFFSMQQFTETKLQSAMFLKDVRSLPGAATAVTGAGAGASAGAALGGIVAGAPGVVIGGALGMTGGMAAVKMGSWTAQKLGKQLNITTPYLRKIVEEPALSDVVSVQDEILGSLQKTMLDFNSSPDLLSVRNAAKNGLGDFKVTEKADFENSIRSRNIWYAAFGQSTVRMATNFNKGLVEKFGMELSDALAFTIEKGVKRYKNPEMVQMLREATQSVYHYKPGVMTSPMMKTLNLVWFPFRFQAKTIQLTANWMNSLTPASRAIMVSNWVHFANWAGTKEGIEWRRKNKNVLYNIAAYTTAYEQMGQSADAIAKGRLFGGNTGLIGGVPFGFLVNIARELAILPEDPDQFNPKTGKPFTKEVPRELISTASLTVAIEQLLISMSPSTPFYSLTSGVIGGVSARNVITDLTRKVIGSTREFLEGDDTSKGEKLLNRDFKTVPLEYSRLTD